MNYKVLFFPKLGEKAKFEKEFKTHIEAEAALAAIAEYTLLLHERGYMPDHSNTGMVLKKDDDGGWIEIDGDGQEI